MALTSGGAVYTWGSNATGQLGIGSTTASSTPVQVTTISNIVGIAAGYTHSLAVQSDGTVWAWGDNAVGEVGDGTTTQRTSPVAVSGLGSSSGMVAVAAGAS
ncbi:MAG: hypothetical protein WDN67_04970 [Candidatus Moraniibacteriota bacterium]